MILLFLLISVVFDENGNRRCDGDRKHHSENSKERKSDKHGKHYENRRNADCAMHHKRNNNVIFQSLHNIHQHCHPNYQHRRLIRDNRHGDKPR